MEDVEEAGEERFFGGEGRVGYCCSCLHDIMGYLQFGSLTKIPLFIKLEKLALTLLIIFNYDF